MERSITFRRRKGLRDLLLRFRVLRRMVRDCDSSLQPCCGSEVDPKDSHRIAPHTIKQLASPVHLRLSNNNQFSHILMLVQDKLTQFLPIDTEFWQSLAFILLFIVSNIFRCPFQWWRPLRRQQGQATRRNGHRQIAVAA